MKQPSLDDRRVKVTAYLTDETFGYEHWRAAQFSAPGVPTARPALLLIFDSDAERDAAAEIVTATSLPEGIAALIAASKGIERINKLFDANMKRKTGKRRR